VIAALDGKAQCSEAIVKLEQIEDEDIPQLARWNVELHEDEGSIPMTIDGAEARLRRWLTDNSFHALKITIDDRPVGYMLFQKVPPSPDLRGSSESIYIRQFYIVREARRSGSGRNAIELFTQYVVSKGHPIHLDVKITNPAGQRFWESLGFEAEHVAYSRKLSGSHGAT
jgi:GNAT superfamily N-acetyltransferase